MYALCMYVYTLLYSILYTLASLFNRPTRSTRPCLSGQVVRTIIYRCNSAMGTISFFPDTDSGHSGLNVRVYKDRIFFLIFNFT